MTTKKRDTESPDHLKMLRLLETTLLMHILLDFTINLNQCVCVCVCVFVLVPKLCLTLL